MLPDAEARNEMINVTRSSMPSFEEYCEEIKELWDSRWLTNMGCKHRELQAELEKRLNCPHVTLYTNGHLALENMLAAFDFPKGSEVITTPFTFVSTTNAIARNGLVPVFCDVDEKDYCIDVEKIESLITEKTVAILPVHVYGNLCRVEEIDRIAKKHGLKVFFDAAHAFGVEYKGVSVANFGNASMFSFHATKVFNTIEGGAVCYADDALTEILDDRKNFGLHGEEGRAIAGNAKMNEFQAAMGICNLRHLDEEIGRRAAAEEAYREMLSGVPGIRLVEPQKNVKPNHAYFPVIFDGYRKNRDQVFEQLKEHDVIARKYFYPITNSFACYSSYPTAGKEKTPVASYLGDRVLTLPLYADLSPEEARMICRIILQ